MTYWSYWGQRTFDACQQQWFFKNKYASALATKEPLRREAFLLSRLKSIYAWRGELVDRVISDYIVPRMKVYGDVDEADVVAHAKSLFDTQLQYGLAGRFREPGMSVGKAGDEFAAFIEIEYGATLDESAIDSAWTDVRTALENFFSMPDLISLLMVATKLVPQRSLDFSVFSAKGRARPDLIAFYQTKAPHIFDWKVHTYGVTDYRRQLAAYAFALERCEGKGRNADIERLRGTWRAQDFKLLEVQLLTRRIREYQVADDDIDDIESQIAVSHEAMDLALSGLEGRFDQNALLPARYPEICAVCPFRKICSEVLCEESKQTTFLF